MSRRKPHCRYKDGPPIPADQFVSDEAFLRVLARQVRENFELRGLSGTEVFPIPYLVDLREPEGMHYCVVTAVAAVMRNSVHGYGDYVDAGADLGWDPGRSYRFSAAFDGVAEDHDRGLRARMERALTMATNSSGR